jgi:DNA processing protein
MEHMSYWLALNRVPYLGAARFRRLEGYFGDLANAWNAGVGELKAAGMEGRVANAMVAARGRTSPDAEVEQLRLAGVTALNWHDSDYPARLKEIADPPPVLYVKGQLLPSDERSVAVVGTRNATSYGREAAARLTADLAQRGITIVSGLARGIDAVAHRAALDGGGRTIAAVASGLDIVYPKEHTGLSQRIQEQGAVISELPLGVRPDRRWFPRRNRLISGITLGTLVVEAGETSGALLTVKHALEQDREVFCVPGSIFSPASRGTNRLIQEGAKLVYDYNDILEELNLSVVTQQLEMELAPLLAQVPQDDNESALLGHLDDQPLHIDDIRRRSSLPIASVSGLLTMLELKGLVRQVGCMHYVRMREATSTYGD